MSGVGEFTAQHEARRALYEAAKVVFADELAKPAPQGIDLYFGFQWPPRRHDVVAITDTSSEVDPRTIGPRRGYDELITLGVSILVWRPLVPNAADPSATERATADRAFDLLRRLQTHVRLNDVELGGTVAWAKPGSSSSAGVTTAENSAKGRLTEVAATFICQHHIR